MIIITQMDTGRVEDPLSQLEAGGGVCVASSQQQQQQRWCHNFIFLPRRLEPPYYGPKRRSGCKHRLWLAR